MGTTAESKFFNLHMSKATLATAEWAPRGEFKRYFFAVPCRGEADWESSSDRTLKLIAPSMPMQLAKVLWSACGSFAWHLGSF
jgi:hypothetical protein